MANNIYLQTPSKLFYTIACSDNGDLTATSTNARPVRIANPIILSGGFYWQLSADDSGFLITTLVNRVPLPLLFLVVTSPSGLLFRINIDAQGFLTTTQIAKPIPPNIPDYIPGPVPNAGQSQFADLKYQYLICRSAANQLGVLLADYSIWCPSTNSFIPWEETNASRIFTQIGQ